MNYEDVKDLDLGITVSNKAPLVDGSAGSGAGVNIGTGSGGAGGAGSGGTSGTGGSGTSGTASGGTSTTVKTPLKTYPLKINVKNAPEGAAFEPEVKAIPISEGSSININDIIDRYPATDLDTGKPAENVRSVHAQKHQSTSQLSLIVDFYKHNLFLL